MHDMINPPSKPKTPCPQRAKPSLTSLPAPDMSVTDEVEGKSSDPDVTEQATETANNATPRKKIWSHHYDHA